MSQHAQFRRVPVPQQAAAKQETITFPAPTRGLILNENESYMQPGAAMVCDNWMPTMKGAALRGGHIIYAELPETTPIISAFNYVSGANHRMYYGNATKLYDVTTASPVAVKTGQTSGNYSASQLANAAGDWLIAVNDTGDAPLRFNGTSWVTLDGTPPPDWLNSHGYTVGIKARDTTDNTYWTCAVAHTSPAGPSTFAAARVANPTYWTAYLPGDGAGWITGPPGTAVVGGLNLVYVCKYRNRYFFIQENSMNAWYLGLNAVSGSLGLIPLSGATTKGGKLLFCASWSIDAGDGIDDKLVFVTDLGEAIVFTGGDPSSADNWRQEGRYTLSPPLGMNAHLAVGGDLLVASVDGILPMTGAITKDRAELELAAVTRNIKPMWREEVIDKSDQSWMLMKWDEYGAIFVTLPGGDPGKQKCLAINAATGAIARFTGWDAMCFATMRGSMYFGTQTGKIMQADRTGYDNGLPYVATIVGGWEVFQSPSQTIAWKQARASFSARGNEPFIPQLSGTTDYVVTIPPAPAAGIDPGVLDLWDQGVWDEALWDAAAPAAPAVRNTGWVSIGVTGFSHAPIIQVTVAQQAKPTVELISIAGTFERLGITV